jgi:hypothetical protein
MKRTIPKTGTKTSRRSASARVASVRLDGGKPLNVRNRARKVGARVDSDRQLESAVLRLRLHRSGCDVQCAKQTQRDEAFCDPIL